MVRRRVVIMKKFIVVFLFSFFCCTSYVYAATGMHWSIGSCTDRSCTADELFADIIGLVNLDFSSTASVFGKFIFSDSNISPSETGQLVYDNNVEGIDDGCFAWWDDDAPRYFIDSPTLPTLNNQ